MVAAIDIVRSFEARTVVPIDVDEVLAVMQQHGVKDQFYIWEVELDHAALQGAVAQWESWDYPTDDGPIYAADIYVAKDLPNDLKRLVLCKELLHVLDPPKYRVATDAEVTTFIERIILPIEAHDVHAADGVKVISDRIAIFTALAVLFPMEARRVFLTLLQQGTTLDDIARLVDLPVRYVSIVMSELWELIYSTAVFSP